MIVWARMKKIQEMVADVSETWLDRFAAAEENKNNVRKMGTYQNAPLLFRSSAVLAAVEAGKTYL